MASFLNLRAGRLQLLPGLLGYGSLILLLTGCGTALTPVEKASPHLVGAAPQEKPASGSIPAIVNPAPLVPPPSAAQEQQLYTAVAQDIPIRDFLFSMARDAAINVDVDPNVTGIITMNAIDQSLPQILERLAHQATIRWHFDEAGNLVVEPDAPYWATYNIDYVNVERNSSTTTDVSTSIVSNVGGAGGGGNKSAGGGNNSSTSVMTQTTSNNFWVSLSRNLSAFLGESTGGTSGNSGATLASSDNMIINAETGVVSIKATSRQQADIAAFIKNVTTRSQYQVLIEATVVEVSLSDQYQAGVNWASLLKNHGNFSIVQNTTSNAPNTVITIGRAGSSSAAGAVAASSGTDVIGTTVELLQQFGESQVLSSPKIMALNNQTAMLRVVDNEVYFTVDVQPGTRSTISGNTDPTYTTAVHTVPVGVVISVTPQIGADDQITLNVRPTISRISRYVKDPNPILKTANTENNIPVISVREMESVLKVYSGDIAVLGGLMEDGLDKNSDGLPVVSRLPGIRNLFSHRKETASKSELVIFIRPIVQKNASIDGDLKNFQQYLPTKSLEADSAAINTNVIPSNLKGKSD